MGKLWAFTAVLHVPQDQHGTPCSYLAWKHQLRGKHRALTLPLLPPAQLLQPWEQPRAEVTFGSASGMQLAPKGALHSTVCMLVSLPPWKSADMDNFPRSDPGTRVCDAFGGLVKGELGSQLKFSTQGGYKLLIIYLFFFKTTGMG